MGLGFQPTEYVDVTSTIETKVAMLEAHESQLTWLRDHDGIDIVEQMRAATRFRGLQCRRPVRRGLRPCLTWLRGTTRRLLPRRKDSTVAVDLEFEYDLARFIDFRDEANAIACRAIPRDDAHEHANPDFRIASSTTRRRSTPRSPPTSSTGSALRATRAEPSSRSSRSGRCPSTSSPRR